MPLPKITKNSGIKIITNNEIIENKKNSVDRKNSTEKKDSIKKNSVEKKNTEKLSQKIKKPIKTNGVILIGVDKNGYLIETPTSAVKYKSIKQYDHDSKDEIININSISQKENRLKTLSNKKSLTEDEIIEYENLNFELNGTIKRKIKNKN